MNRASNATPTRRPSPAPAPASAPPASLAGSAPRRSGDVERRASESRLRSLIDNMLEGLISFDANGVIESVNPAAARIFGYGSAELIGRNLEILVPESAATDTRTYLATVFRQSLGQINEVPGRRKNGETFPVGLSAFQFGTPEWMRFAFNMRDLSERREIERLKTAFVASVSHELRTPLTSIRGSLSLLGGKLAEASGEARELVAIADRNCVRLIGLIDDILDVERLAHGKLEITLGTVSLAAVLERSLESVQGFAATQGIALELAAGGEALVLGDLGRLVQVAVNLLSNAIKFSPRGGAVRLCTEARQGFVDVRVRDHGRGIPARMRQIIFERFQQVEAADARYKGGAGLGLAIAKAIVEQHQGTIGVESEEGVGSTFWFRLPLAPGTAAGEGG
jgi:PAS domain S-box-containing protein